MKNYTDASTICDGVPKKLSDGCTLIPVAHGILVTYMNLPLILYDSSGSITLYNDECSTIARCNRLNKYTPSNVKIKQKDFMASLFIDGVSVPFEKWFCMEVDLDHAH